jgi:hypothetical protein
MDRNQRQDLDRYITQSDDQAHPEWFHRDVSEVEATARTLRIASQGAGISNNQIWEEIGEYRRARWLLLAEELVRRNWQIVPREEQ